MLLAVTDIGPQPGEGPAFLSAVLTDGTLFPLAALAIVLPLFLPVAVALVGRGRDRRRGPAGHAALPPGPAGRPDPAAGRQAGRVMAFVLLTRRGRRRSAYVVGRRCSSATATSGTITTVSGAALLAAASWSGARSLALGYARCAMLGVASIALFLSTVTDSPLGAAFGALALLVASTLLLTLDAADCAAPVPADALLARLRRPVPRPDPVARRRPRLAAAGAYVVVFLAAGWANFATKDIKD